MTFNRERGEWPLETPGKTYKLRLTTNAMAELETPELSKGRTWDQIVAGLSRGSVADCRLFLWAALRDYHPDVATPDLAGLKAVGDLVDEAGGLAAILEQIRAFVQSNAKPEQEGAARPPAAVAGEPAAAIDGTGEAPMPASSRSV